MLGNLPGGFTIKLKNGGSSLEGWGWAGGLFETLLFGNEVTKRQQELADPQPELHLARLGLKWHSQLRTPTSGILTEQRAASPWALLQTRAGANLQQGAQGQPWKLSVKQSSSLPWSPPF